jgi:hypothetical protein
MSKEPIQCQRNFWALKGMSMRKLCSIIPVAARSARNPDTEQAACCAQTLDTEKAQKVFSLANSFATQGASQAS